MSNAKKNETTVKTAGEKMMNALKRRGKPMTTEELAKVADVSVKDAYSRLWWLQKKEGLLKSTGRGKERQWQFSARGLKSMAPPAES
jgi:predicted HTH transcriptional regulator